MVHPLTVKKLRDVLLDPSQWQIVSSLLAPDIRPLSDHYFDTWLEKHTHSHKAIEVMIAMDGNGTYGLQGRVYPAPPGTVFIIGPGEDHAVGYPERCLVRFTHLWIGVYSEFCDVTYVLRSGKHYEDTSKIDGLVVTTTDSCVSLEQCLGELYRETKRDSNVVRAKIVGALMLLTSAIAERADTPTAAATHSFQKDVVEMIQEHIARTGGKDANLDNLARVSGYSKYYLSRLFRQHTGRSIHDYVDLCRATRCVELRNAGHSKTEIAQALGFSCLSAFVTWEHRWYGRPNAAQKLLADTTP